MAIDPDRRSCAPTKPDIIPALAAPADVAELTAHRHTCAFIHGNSPATPAPSSLYARRKEGFERASHRSSPGPCLSPHRGKCRRRMMARASTANPISVKLGGSGTLAGGPTGGPGGRLGGIGVGGPPPLSGGKEGGAPPFGLEKRNRGDGRNATADGGAASGWAIGTWVAGAGALMGGGASRDLTRTMGCGGNGAALRRAETATTQAVVATACGSFSQAARVPVHSRQVQVRWSNIIIRMTPASCGR